MDTPKPTPAQQARIDATEKAAADAVQNLEAAHTPEKVASILAAVKARVVEGLADLMGSPEAGQQLANDLQVLADWGTAELEKKFPPIELFAPAIGKGETSVISAIENEYAQLVQKAHAAAAAADAAANLQPSPTVGAVVQTAAGLLAQLGPAEVAKLKAALADA
jgi:hypothetical protein